MSTLGSDVFGELRRQLSMRQQMLAKINARDDQLAEQRQQLDKRRRRYSAKNNGKGRPPKRIPHLSQADERARHSAGVEIAVLERVLQCPSQMVLVDWIEWLQRHYGGQDADLAVKKLNRLRKQFSPTAPSPNAARAWDATLGRAFLQALHLRQRGRLVLFAEHEAQEPWDKVLEDRERTRLRVIERFLGIHDLSSASRIVAHNALIRHEPVEDHAVHDQVSYLKSWAGEVAWLTNQLKRHFLFEDQ